MNAQDQVCQYNTSTQTWTQISGVSLDQVWATFDGAVWGVNSAGNPYQWNSTTGTFSLVAGNVTQVVLGNAANVWATNAVTAGVFFWF